jgi:hypothetical protein
MGIKMNELTGGLLGTVIEAEKRFFATKKEAVKQM